MSMACDDEDNNCRERNQEASLLMKVGEGATRRSHRNVFRQAKSSPVPEAVVLFVQRSLMLFY